MNRDERKQFARYIGELREKRGITMKQLCQGLCSDRNAMYIERGERDTPRVLREALLERLGVGAEDYECYLGCEDYARWKMQQQIIHCIIYEKTGQAEAFLEKYRDTCCTDEDGSGSIHGSRAFRGSERNLEQQFILSMQAQIQNYRAREASRDGGRAEAGPLFREALGLTVPAWEESPVRELVLSLKELNLLLEAERCREQERPERYREVLDYLVSTGLDRRGMAKIYPKVVYFLCRRLMEEYGAEEGDWDAQCSDYHVVSAPTKDEGILQKQLLRGEGADLMEVGRIHKGDLARHGAFEDLSPYYEGSQAVKEEDILEPVREACTIGGKNVAVIPSFRIDSMFDIGYSSAGDPWTVWKFLEFGEGNRMFSSQSPSMALNYCMGIKYGEHFIDYEGRTCSFDGEEFRRILESCAKWEKYVEYSEDGHQTDGSIGQGDWLFGTWSVSGLGDILGIYRERCIGYPGWEGGEYPLQAYSVFAINSASKQKEGAWDFLEYLLSEETQELIWQMDGLFPARKDSFEDYLQYEYGFLGQKETKATEEDVDYLREMVGTAVFEDFGLDSVWGIVSEEAEMYFAGDATLDATVQKIQTRVQLYLDEL
ncbi:MAG TPA: hypothetical protein DCZ91_14575 [Lachnospiraceae bacterium]|nr:hypothetical protein [Lachnospiraceae bacterium]